MIRSKDATIVWNDDDQTGLITTIALVDQSERILAMNERKDDEESGWEKAREFHRFDQQYDLSFGACCAGWMEEGSGLHHSTPEALFLEFCLRGFASVDAFRETLSVFAELDTCDWARYMIERPERWEADVQRRLDQMGERRG